jgi:hypothetical protein
MQELAFQLLTMPWPPWGYLIWRENNSMGTTLMTRIANFGQPKLADCLMSVFQEKKTYSEVPHAIRKIEPWAQSRRRGDAFSIFNPRQTRDLIYLENAVKNVFPHCHHILHILSVIFITSAGFQENVEHLIYAKPEILSKK